MKTIYKFPLQVTEQQIVSLPKNATIVSVHNQFGHSDIFMWVLLDEADPFNVPRKILMFGTGWEANVEEDQFLGTVMVGPYVWHYFDGGEL